MRAKKVKLSKVQKEVMKSFRPHLQQLKGNLLSGHYVDGNLVKVERTYPMKSTTY